MKSARKVPFFILWPEFPCFRPAFQARVSGPCFRPVFQARVSGPCFRPVFQARVLGPRFRPASWATAVHCKSSPKSDLNTFEARLVYTSIQNFPVQNTNMTFGGTVCLPDFSIHWCCFLGRQPLLHVSGDALPSAPAAQSVPWKENQDGDQLHWAI